MSETVTLQDLKKTWTETKQLFEGQFKEAVQKGQAETKELGDQLGVTKEKIARMENTFQAFDKTWETWKAEKAALEAKQAAIEAVLTKWGRPHTDGTAEPEIKPELKKFFSAPKEWSRWVRVGEERLSADEVKALTTDDNSAGGYLLPHNRYAGIIEKNVLSSPIRQVAQVYSISTGDALEVPKEGSTVFSCGWTSERAARTATTSGTFAMDRIPVNEMYADPYVTQKMIDDAAFDIEAWIDKKLAEQFAKTENTAFVAGTGFGQPEGITVNAAAITASVIASGTGVFTAALLIDMQHTLEEPYASNATWLTKRSNFGKIRQLVLSSYGDFIWQPGISLDKGPTLLGSPYLACNDFLAIGTASATNPIIAYGDWKSAYMIVDRVGISMLRDPFTNKPYIEFYATKRVGGQVVNSEAMVLGRKDS